MQNLNKRLFSKDCTDIICTLGPSSYDTETLEKLIVSGMTIARFNMSHSDHNFHNRVKANLKMAEKRTGKRIKKIFDLQGPKLRTTKITNNEKYHLKEGEFVHIEEGLLESTKGVIYINYKNLFEDLKIGDRIYFGDCNLAIEIIGKNKDLQSCLGIVKLSGTLKSKIGVHFKGYKKTSSITEKDKDDLRFVIGDDCDAICMSFVNNYNDIIEMKEFLKSSLKSEVPIIAKIESRDGFYNLDQIIDVSDAIMIARGDLGISFPLEQLPFIQTKIIEKIKEKNTFAILATQLFFSMVNTPFPTRAEVNDTVHALMQGVNALMLSEESSIGEYPINTVKCMTKLINNFELYKKNKLIF